jgi:FtsP/CotA-like multicopper oxidase with cupredoxin domain
MRILVASLITAVASILPLPAQQATGPIDPPADARSVLQAKGDGVQIYVCTDAPVGLKWVLKAPDAKLLDASGKTIGKHFAGPTWRLADGSQVQGELMANKPAPEENSVPWLLLRAKPGTATGSLANIKFIRRTETHGGVAPESGCQTPLDAGKTVQIPYTATYTFYAEN